MSTCRIILMTNSTSKVIPAIRSRCLAVRVAAPSNEELCSVLSTVAKKEGLNLPNDLASRIAEKSNRNLRRAILMLQSCKVAQYPFSPDQAIVDLDWEVTARVFFGTFSARLNKYLSENLSYNVFLAELGQFLPELGPFCV